MAHSLVTASLPSPVGLVNNGQFRRSNNSIKASVGSSMGTFRGLQSTSLAVSSFTGLRSVNGIDTLVGRTGQSLQSVVAAETFLGKREGRTSRMTTLAMFERFTEKSIEVIKLSQEEVRRMGHNSVGTEHILLGLIGEGTSVAAQVLECNEINLKDARVEVEKINSSGSGTVVVEIPFTPRAKRVLELSSEEARKLGHNYIGPEHLLLGLLQQVKGVGVRALRNLGADLLEIYTWVIVTLHVNDAIGAGNHTPPPEDKGKLFDAAKEFLENMRKRRQDFQKRVEQHGRGIDTGAYKFAPVLQNKETANETEAGKEGIAVTESDMLNNNKYQTVLTISFNGEPGNYTVNTGAPQSITVSISSSEKVKTGKEGIAVTESDMLNNNKYQTVLTISSFPVNTGKEGIAVTESDVLNNNKYQTVLTISFNGEPANYTVNTGAPQSIKVSISSSEKVKTGKEGIAITESDMLNNNKYQTVLTISSFPVNTGKEGIAVTESDMLNNNKYQTVLTISFNGEPANYTVNTGAPQSITVSISSSEKVKMVIDISETSEKRN